MNWTLSHRADPRALPIADRHYNRQKVGSPQFVPPGRCIVLLSTETDALWVSSWPFAEYVKHDWPGAWVNSCFRREPTAARASDLIWDAVSATNYFWPPPSFPCRHCGHEVSMLSFIDTDHVRRKRDYGRCYIKAGWRRCTATTKAGLIVVHVGSAHMPAASRPVGFIEQLPLIGVTA
jgi:hypothetical protein